MVNYLVIAAGAAVGANLRYMVTVWATTQWGTQFPYGTMLINIVGSLLIGLLAAIFLQRAPANETLRLLLITGLLGGFTTFSAFSYELYGLISSGNYVGGALYLLGSVGGGLVATVVGMGVGRMLASAF